MPTVRSLQKAASATLLGLLLAAALDLPQSARAANYSDAYVPPEIAYAGDLAQHVTLPGRINVNKGTLNELKLIPGLDEELALKVMRGRPYADIQDFYKKLPLDKKQLDRLIQQIQPKVLFN